MSLTYVEQPINKARVQPILAKTSSQSLETHYIAKSKQFRDNSANRPTTFTNQDYHGSPSEQNSCLNGKKSSLPRRPFLGLSRLRGAASEFGLLAFGAIALEMVIAFSFSSLEGLFLIMSTLAVGTSVYVIDGIKREPDTKILRQ